MIEYQEPVHAIDPSGIIHELIYPRSDAFFEGHDLLPCDGREIPADGTWANLRILMANKYPGGIARVPDLRAYRVAPVKAPCSHEFKLYEGFTERYEYCVHCDAKRSP